jgi:hypothetical protein
VARARRAFAQLRFRVLGLATIKDIPTEQFNSLVKELGTRGWRKTGEYEGLDAGIDYDSFRMRRRGIQLKFEWDNWTEGSVEGPRAAIEEIAQQFGLRVTHERTP